MVVGRGLGGGELLGREGNEGWWLEGRGSEGWWWWLDGGGRREELRGGCGIWRGSVWN